MKSKKKPAEKPYSCCLFCSKRRSSPPECTGPLPGSMTTRHWREYIQDIMDIDGLTFEAIAERTNGLMSARSVRNFLAPGATGELTRDRALVVANAIFGVSGDRPCSFDLPEGLDADAKKVKAIEGETAEPLRNL